MCINAPQVSMREIQYLMIVNSILGHIFTCLQIPNFSHCPGHFFSFCLLQLFWQIDDIWHHSVVVYNIHEKLLHMHDLIHLCQRCTAYSLCSTLGLLWKPKWCILKCVLLDINLMTDMN